MIAFDGVTVRNCSGLSSISSTNSKSAWSPAAALPLILECDSFFLDEDEEESGPIVVGVSARPPRRVLDAEDPGVPVRLR